MTYKRKLQITVPDTSQQYDPLRRYYSRAGFMKPVREDSSLLASETDSGSKVKWSLGGYTENNPDAIKTPTQKQMDDWAAAHKPTLQSETEIRENQYLTRGPDEEVISLPKVLQQLRINTIDKIMRGQYETVKRELDSIQIYNEEGGFIPESGIFLGTILTSVDPDGFLYMTIRQMFDRDRNLRPRFSTLGAFFELASENLYTGVGTKSIQDRLAVFKALRQIFGTEELKRIKPSQLMYPWVLKNVIKNRP